MDIGQIMSELELEPYSQGNKSLTRDAFLQQCIQKFPKVTYLLQLFKFRNFVIIE